MFLTQSSKQSDIGKIDAFKEIIAQVQHVVKYFHKSTNGTSTLKLKWRFVLDPRFRNVHVMQDLNLLEIPKIKIGPRDSTGKPAKSNEKLPPTLNFTAGEWWAKLDKNPDAQPLTKLAHSLFEILPNSMCDEHTASTFTWLNSPLRNKQDVSTLMRMTMIREWYRFNPENHPDPFHPTVKFCDMTELLFQDKVSSSPLPGSLGKHHEMSDSSSEEIVFDAQDVDFNNFVKENDNDNEDDAKDSIYKYAADKLDLESQINLACLVLRDVLSDKGLDSHILEMSANVDEADEEYSGEDSDDLEDDTLWKLD
ncbi:hypothetical protein ACEPAI_3446 [Sanghuangporus weigelae]